MSDSTFLFFWVLAVAWCFTNAAMHGLDALDRWVARRERRARR